MLIKQLGKEYDENGYVIFNQLFTKEEVVAARADCDNYFSGDKTHMATKDFLKFQHLRQMPFMNKVREAVASVLGDDYVTINQLAVADNMHSPQWHRDSGDQGPEEYLFDPSYQIAKCGLYLQDNDPVWGGGMEIIPRSHRTGPLGCSFPISRSHMDGKISRIQGIALKWRNDRLPRVWLPIKAGDLFLFHANLWHRASQPDPSLPKGGYQGVQLLNPPPEKRKYLVDWEVSKNNKFLQIYIDHQKMRGAKSEPLFLDSLNNCYPRDYPQDLVQVITESGARVVNYSD